MIIIRTKVNYTKNLKPIYIPSVQANQVYINEIKNNTESKIEYKIGDKWIEFESIWTREAVLNDSLFLRYMKSSITRNSGDICNDFIVLKFNYAAEYRIDGKEFKEKEDELRDKYYRDGVEYVHEKKDKNNNVVSRHSVKYKMLMRTPGKAKNGECVFIRESLHHKAINFLTMGLYDLMDKESKNDPEKIFKIVEMSAYMTLTTATAIDFIQIPFNRILVVPDESVKSKPMNAMLVGVSDIPYYREEFVVDFDNPRLEAIINKKGFTYDLEKSKSKGLILLKKKSKDELKKNGIRVTGKYPGEKRQVEFTRKECTVKRVTDKEIENILWDGMGLIDESIFPSDMNGFIYCRSHFFKSCLFRGNIQEFFKDYCREYNLDYANFTTEKIDMFGRKLSLSNIQVVISDKSLKWLKFIDMMGGTQEEAFRFYKSYMKENDNWFSIVKTAHSSKWGNYQQSAYQMNNSLPTVDRTILRNITSTSTTYYNSLKDSNDEEYLKYLEKNKNNFNINEMIVELIKWNPDFRYTEFFRNKKTKDLNKFKNEYLKQGKLLQEGDNLTIMDNPIALLLKAVGDDPLKENCFSLMSNGVQCYAPRFAEGDRLAAFRSPHNSPNNIIHLYNVYPEQLVKYFPNIGKNVIVFNAIGTDTQARLSGHDVDSDFVYTTNQCDLANLARKAYVEYPTIINEVPQVGTSTYHFALTDFAHMDNKIASAQESIGTSTDTAQLALSYYYDEGMTDKELEEQFVILSVIGQVSIDLAKKEFDINVVKEIRRIKQLECMKNKGVPKFYANIKKSRNNKEFAESDIREMNCPMDIISDLIDENVIYYSDALKHRAIRTLYNTSISEKGNRYKINVLVDNAKDYNDCIKKLEGSKEKYTDDVFLALKNRCTERFLNKVSKNLDQETIMKLVTLAFKDDNSDIRNVILNFLFRQYHDEFMNCFVKKQQK